MLISYTDIKTFLGIPTATTTDDTSLATLCANAQGDAESYVDYKLEGASAIVEYLDGEGIDIIQLRNLPVKSIQSLYDDNDRVYGADTLISSDDYTFNGKAGIVTLTSLLFAKGTNNVKVTYTAGYGSGFTDLPNDLKQALVYLASAIYLEGKAGVQVMVGQEMTYRPSWFKKEAYKILDRYRRLSL